jgi:hypothetical protein
MKIKKEMGEVRVETHIQTRTSPTEIALTRLCGLPDNRVRAISLELVFDTQPQ